MKTIAITGSSGFIGQHLVKELQDKAYELVLIDYDNGFDLLKNEDINRISKFDTIVHLAAKSFVPQSFKTPWEFYNHNFSTTLNVLELARRYSAKVIFFSSYLYGQPDYLPIDENHPLKPHNPYAQSKLICENLCEGYFRDFNVPIAVFRPFNIYGSGQNNAFLIPLILEQFKTGVVSLKDPRPKRDFIHISDVVKAVLLAIEKDLHTFDTFNIGYGKSFSIAEIIEIIKEVSKSQVEVKFSHEIRQGEVMDTIADTSKLNSILKWNAEVDLYEGIKETITRNQ